MMADKRCFSLTLARFLRHSVQALGVTTPRPRRRLEEVVGRATAAEGVPEAPDDESSWPGVAAPVGVGRVGAPVPVLVPAGGTVVDWFGVEPDVMDGS